VYAHGCFHGRLRNGVKSFQSFADRQTEHLQRAATPRCLGLTMPRAGRQPIGLRQG
jgi:hypothetical protein